MRGQAEWPQRRVRGQGQRRADPTGEVARRARCRSGAPSGPTSRSRQVFIARVRRPPVQDATKYSAPTANRARKVNARAGTDGSCSVRRTAPPPVRRHQRQQCEGGDEHQRRQQQRLVDQRAGTPGRARPARHPAVRPAAPGRGGRTTAQRHRGAARRLAPRRSSGRRTARPAMPARWSGQAMPAAGSGGGSAGAGLVRRRLGGAGGRSRRRSFPHAQRRVSAAQALVLLPLLAHLVAFFSGGSCFSDLYCSRAWARFSASGSAHGRICCWTRCFSSGDIAGSAARCRATLASAARRACPTPAPAGPGTCLSAGESSDHEGDASGIGCANAYRPGRPGTPATARISAISSDGLEPILEAPVQVRVDGEIAMRAAPASISSVRRPPARPATAA